MKYYLTSLTLLVLVGCARPLVTTHVLTKKDIALAKMKGYGRPKHTTFSPVLCWDEKCRERKAWEKRQQKRRFKRYKRAKPILRPVPQAAPETMVAQQDTVQVAPSKVTAAVAPKVRYRENETYTFSNLTFAFGKAVILPSSYDELDSLYEFLEENPKYKVIIHGHTDIVGTKAFNKALSMKRSHAVGEYLIAKGISPARMGFFGHGASQPIATNQTDEGRRLNRRVAFVIRARE